MTIGRSLGVGTVMVVALASGAARAQDAGTTPIASTDFTLTVSRVDSAGTQTALTGDQLAAYFSRARCACSTNVVVTLAIDANAAAQLDGHTLDAQLVVGSDCDLATTTTCPSIGGTLTFTTTATTTSQTIVTSTIFADATGSNICPTTTSSSRLWAIARYDGSRLATEPSVPLTLGGAGPSAPTTVMTTTADDGLLVSWTATGDGTTLSGHQVLCAPGPTTASAATYDLCAADVPDGGTGPFATFDPSLVCSGLVTVGTNSVRIHGLTNGQAYQIAVVAVGIDGTPSAPSAAATGTPGPTVGFIELYQDHGGTATTGCALGGARARRGGSAALALAAVVIFAARRRRRGGRGRRRGAGPFVAALALFGGLAALGPGAARADEFDSGPQSFTMPGDEVVGPSPRAWNFELGFGPYRPDVDSEFADRGLPARPYADIFSNSNHLMTQIEIDRHVSHRGGTWAVGVGVGYFSVSAAALAADLQTRSGDQTTLRLYPLAAGLVYRADTLRERHHFPLVPYAKLGLDCTFWRATDTSRSGATDGKTTGWHAAAGVAFDLAGLDPEAARDLDRESGVNETAVFFEVARYSLDGFGSSSALRVGDTTWLAGLMLEL
jgi:hypothetical protein